jgi:hypothetical protein
VQIMSPHFEAQPRKPVVVPKSGWYAPPVSSPNSGTANEPEAVEPRQVDTRATLSAAPEPKSSPSRIAKTERKRPQPVRAPRPKPPTI